jgi:YHS domain-containing protein
MEMSEMVKDVVCRMDVGPHQNPVMHLGQEYAFCSVQCQERFAANPHLYIGLPGRQAWK